MKLNFLVLAYASLIVSTVAYAQQGPASINELNCAFQRRQANELERNIMGQISSDRLQSWKSHHESVLHGLLSRINPEQLSALRDGYRLRAQVDEELERHRSVHAQISQLQARADEARSQISSIDLQRQRTALTQLTASRDTLRDSMAILRRKLSNNPTRRLKRQLEELLSSMRPQMEELNRNVVAANSALARGEQEVTANNSSIANLTAQIQSLNPTGNDAEIARLENQRATISSLMRSRTPGEILSLRTFSDRASDLIVSYNPSYNPNSIPEDADDTSRFFPPYFTDAHGTIHYGGNQFDGYEETVFNPDTLAIERCYYYHFSDASLPAFDGVRLCSSSSYLNPQQPIQHRFQVLNGNAGRLPVSIGDAREGLMHGIGTIHNFAGDTPVDNFSQIVISPECRAVSNAGSPQGAQIQDAPGAQSHRPVPGTEALAVSGQGSGVATAQ